MSETIVSLLSMLKSIALARLLTPEVFGLMGLADTAMRAVEVITRPGVSQALIARQRNFDDASGTAFTLLVARGVVLAAFLIVVAPFVAAFYVSDELEPMLRALSLVFLVGGVSNINTIARIRELEFRKLTYLSQITSLVSTVGTVALALWLRSVWALVFGQIASVIVNTALSYWLIEGRVRFIFDRAIARDLLSYGKFITGSSIVGFILVSIDFAVVGKILGPEQLGFYSLATTISTLVTLQISRMASNVMMPAYSKLQADPPALRGAYLRALSLMMYAVLPASLGLIVTAESIIDVLYGEAWLNAVPPLRILAAFGIFRALLSFTGYLFEGIGHPQVAFRLALLRFVCVVPLMVPMVHRFGLSGAALTVTIGGMVQWFAGHVYLWRHVAVNPLDCLRSVWRPLWTSCVMMVCVYAISRVVDCQAVSGLVVMIATGVIVYGALNIRVATEFRHERF